ncbi:hypothetical protein H4Q26_009728 [Puccinia striiformis f. sp. tritici PST-130]|nr:hypothetical protein H4Q26_009728 [Puccinia striiformis f. sp. tritici PST-130]
MAGEHAEELRSKGGKKELTGTEEQVCLLDFGVAVWEGKLRSEYLTVETPVTKESQES